MRNMTDDIDIIEDKESNEPIIRIDDYNIYKLNYEPPEKAMRDCIVKYFESISNVANKIFSNDSLIIKLIIKILSFLLISLSVILAVIIFASIFGIAIGLPLAISNISKRLKSHSVLTVLSNAVCSLFFIITISHSGQTIKPYKSNKDNSTSTFYIGHVLKKEYKVKITNPLITEWDSTILIDNKSLLTAADDIDLSLNPDIIGEMELEKEVKETVINFFSCAANLNKDFEDLKIDQNYTTEKRKALRDDFNYIKDIFFFDNLGTHISTSAFKIKNFSLTSNANLISQNRCRFYV